MLIMLSHLCLFYLFASVIDSVEIGSKSANFKRLEKYYNYQVADTEKVDLKVYYECLCPDCIKFHTGSLDDTYKKIGSYIDLKLYPYGNARKTENNGQIVINCQHGPAECYGNKLHACAIDILKDVSTSEFYNTCMMTQKWGGRGSTDMDAVKCGEEMKIDARPIISCAKSKRGEDLLEYYGTETDKVPGKQYVPWVVLNGEHFNEEDDLMKKICEVLTSPPPQCKTYYTTPLIQYLN